jgi:putative selenium metabolism protein SsnA
MLITNATVIPWGASNRILERHALYLEGDRIVDLGPSSELQKKYPHAEALDARGQYVMPGNICAHTHFYGAFARGIAIPGDPPKDFPEILERLWWKLDKALTPDDAHYSALVCLIDAIKHGTTTLIDHHASPNAIEGSLDVVAEAVNRAGLRACLCYEVTDRDGPERAKAGIAENLRFIQSRIRNPQSTIAATFGLHASLTLSDATLEACRDAYDGAFHIHAAEHESDQYDSLKKSGLRVIDRLNKFGVLSTMRPGRGRARSIVAHAVHIDHREAELLAANETWVTHQPRSNMNNAVGVADVEGLLRAGVKVALGNDGFSNAMWDEWKAAYLYHKAARRDPRQMGGATVAEMAVVNNAALAGEYFPQAPIGVLAPGAFADIIFVDYSPITPLTADNLPWHILFGFENSMVTTTICAGRVLMKDRRLLFLDEAEVAAKSRELAKGVWRRLGA